MYKKLSVLLFTILFLLTLAPLPALADGEPPQPQRDCTPDELFTHYEFVTPTETMPDVESPIVAVSWNFQCSHDASVQILSTDGTVVRTLDDSRHFAKGDSTLEWDCLGTDGNLVLDGEYHILITPLDEFAAFAVNVQVTTRLFQYPSLYGIFGDQLKNHVKQVP